MDELIRGSVRVQWSELGEGYSGDYDPDDPDDVELLRFYVSVKGPLVANLQWGDLTDDRWQDVDDASYCTEVPVSATPAERQVGLKIIMDEVEGPLNDGQRIKKLCERLSWINLLTIAKNSVTL